MTTIHLDGSSLPLVLEQADDVDIRFAFDADVSAWTEWYAQARDKDDNTWDFTFDTSLLVSDLIVVASLTLAQTQEMFGASKIHWQLRALDDEGKDRTLIGSDSTIVVKRNVAVRT